MESNIDLKSPNFYDYQKKNEYKTIFDDKKILERKQFGSVSKGNGESSFINKNGTTTELLPTTSAAYGIYYKEDYKKKFFW